LTDIYVERKKTSVEGWQQYSNLLIDKFAIHSSTFFHISEGLIEHSSSNDDQKRKGYDLFTANTTFRVIMETYVAFNHIFVEPTTEEEKHFRFLLWKLDGLFQLTKYDIEINDFESAQSILETKTREREATIRELQENCFLKKFSESERVKIFDPEKKKAKWRFQFENRRIRPLQIIDLIKHCCKIRAFVNMYRYSSIHTHSNFPSVDEFREIRGRLINDKYIDSVTRLGIYLTCLMICDICRIDSNSKRKFDSLPKSLTGFIEGITKSVMENG
jgi:hypothetical protein